MRTRFNVGDRVTLPVGTVLRNTVTGEPSVWNQPAALTQPLTGTLRTPPSHDQRCAHLGEWFQFVADSDSGLASERSRFNLFLYPEADLELIPPDDEWVSVGHALPPVDEPVLCHVVNCHCYVAWRDKNGRWNLTETGSYAIDSQPDFDPTHWRKLPALPEPPPFTR